ncbi:MAG: hypothetical protein ACTSU5_14985 [Promethearchaeota archaeon]
MKREMRTTPSTKTIIEAGIFIFLFSLSIVLPALYYDSRYGTLLAVPIAFINVLYWITSYIQAKRGTGSFSKK